MGARQKLNQAHLNAALLIGGTLGLLTGSLGVFLIATSSMVALDLLSGGIRPTRRK